MMQDFQHARRLKKCMDPEFEDQKL